MALLNWGNAFSKAGGAIADVGMEGVKAALEQDKIRLSDALAGARESAGDVRRESFKVAGETRAEAATVRGEERGIANIPRTQAVQEPGMLSLERGRSGIRQEEHKATKKSDFDLEYSPENVDKRIAAATKIAGAEAQIRLDKELAAVSKKGNDPRYLSALRKIAVASQVLTPGQVTEGDIKKLELSRAQTLNTMQGAYAAAIADRDPTRANDIVQAMSARFFDPAKLKDAPELKAAQAILGDVLASAEDKGKAREYIMRALASSGAKIGDPDTAGPVKPKTMADVEALAPGTTYIDPRDGNLYKRKAAPPPPPPAS